eukprot:gene12911-12726_t
MSSNAAYLDSSSKFDLLRLVWNPHLVPRHSYVPWPKCEVRAVQFRSQSVVGDDLPVPFPPADPSRSQTPVSLLLRAPARQVAPDRPKTGLRQWLSGKPAPVPDCPQDAPPQRATGACSIHNLSPSTQPGYAESTGLMGQ